MCGSAGLVAGERGIAGGKWGEVLGLIFGSYYQYHKIENLQTGKCHVCICLHTPGNAPLCTLTA